MSMSTCTFVQCSASVLSSDMQIKCMMLHLEADDDDGDDVDSSHLDHIEGVTQRGDQALTLHNTFNMSQGIMK